MSDHIIYSIILISVAFLILFIKNYKKKNSNGERLERLEHGERGARIQRLDRFSLQIASNNRLDLSVFDHFQKKTLGFDELKNKVLFIDLGNDIVQVVDMNDVGDCKLIKKQLSIQLEVNYQDQDKDPLTITFYHKFRDYKWMRSKLEQKAIYWESLLCGVLNEKYEPVKLSGAKA